MHVFSFHRFIYIQESYQETVIAAQKKPPEEVFITSTYSVFIYLRLKMSTKEKRTREGGEKKAHTHTHGEEEEITIVGMLPML